MANTSGSVQSVGVKGSSDHEEAANFVAKLRSESVQRGFTPRKIVEILLNIDETGLVYKSFPNRTYMQRNEVFCAKRPVKDRVTVLLGASMEGFELKPLDIGKSAHPRALIGCDLNALPVHYYDQKHA